jgi:hypothetical protein
MKRIMLSGLLMLRAAMSASAQAKADTIYRISLDTQDVTSTRIWANDTVRYHYNQMKYNVKTILPYLDEAVALFNELDARLHDPVLKGTARRDYIRGKEAHVRSRFEERIRSLNETQGVLLIKLIARQTGFNIYQQLADFKGALPAMKWQAWARLHRFNLNRKYHPEEEPDLEHIMRSLGYPLPRYSGAVAEY